jgi:hypothetical protein
MLVSLIGAKGCGKTSAADWLVENRGFTKVSMAGGLKDMLAAIGLTREQLYGADKEVPSELLCGHTPRHAMQTLGTEWGRRLIGENIWVNAAKAIISLHLENKTPVVVDDVRFHNESSVIRELGGATFLIRRDIAEMVPDSHESEAYWRQLSYDIEIRNDGSHDEFYELLTRGVERLLPGGD